VRGEWEENRNEKIMAENRGEKWDVARNLVDFN